MKLCSEVVSKMERLSHSSGSLEDADDSDCELGPDQGVLSQKSHGQAVLIKKTKGTFSQKSEAEIFALLEKGRGRLAVLFGGEGLPAEEALQALAASFPDALLCKARLSENSLLPLKLKIKALPALCVFSKGVLKEVIADQATLRCPKELSRRLKALLVRRTHVPPSSRKSKNESESADDEDGA